MKVTEKKLADGVIKLDCEATAIEVNNALKEAAEAFALSMGVRPMPGKSIEELAKEQLGIADLDKIVEPNAIEVLVPRALDRRNLVPAFPPKATPTVKFERGKKFTFTLNVTVKPTYELTSYEPVEITVPPFTFDETPINQQLEEIAKNSVTYVVADAKPLEAGDACSIAMKCFDDGEEIKALTCEDRTYLMGRGYMPEGFDEALVGMEPGQTKEFTFEAPLGTENGEVVNKPISCTVTVKEIQQEVVPIIDDAWVKANMPMFASKEALVADMRRVFEAQQREAYEGYVQQMAVGQLTRRFEGRIADEIYEATRDQLMQNLRMELPAGRHDMGAVRGPKRRRAAVRHDAHDADPRGARAGLLPGRGVPPRAHDADRQGYGGRLPGHESPGQSQDDAPAAGGRGSRLRSARDGRAPEGRPLRGLPGEDHRSRRARGTR